MSLGLGLGLPMQRASGVVFSPVSLFGASDQGALWDWSAANAAYQDTAATTPAGNGDATSLLKDQSGKGNDIINSAGTGGSPPTRTQAGALWYGLFTGGTIALAKLAAILPGNDNYTIMAAIRISGTGAGAVYMQRNVDGTPIIGFLTSGSPPKLTQQARDDANHLVQLVQTNSTALDTDVVLGCTMASSNVMTAYKNGAADGTNSSTTFGATTTTASAMGVAPINPPSGTGQAFNGRIYAMLVINRVLTSLERANLTTWLGAKAGLTL